MASTILSRRLNKVSLLLSNSSYSSSEDDLIRKLDYDKIEEELNVHKYQPQYIHNDIDTPNLRRLICDKPIYANANKHLRRKQHKEPKDIRVKQKEEKSDKSHMQHEKRRLEKCEVSYAQGKERKALEGLYTGHNGNLEDIESLRHPVKSSNNEKMVEVNTNHHLNAHNQTNANHHHFDSKDKTRKSSLTDKFKLFVIRKDTGSSRTSPRELDPKDQLNHDELGLVRKASFDQTKSSMTAARKKSQLLKLKFNAIPGRRASEQIGKFFYFFFFY